MSSGAAATVLGAADLRRNGLQHTGEFRRCAGPQRVGHLPQVGGRGRVERDQGDARIALVWARTALPVVAASQQQALAASVLARERMLAGLDGRPSGWLSEPSRQALVRVPHAAQLGLRLHRNIPITPKAFRQRSAPYAGHTAAERIAQGASGSQTICSVTRSPSL